MSSSLPKLFAEYEELHDRMKKVEHLIIDEVMKLKSTQRLGRVTASYSGGRTTYMYDRADVPPDFLDNHTVYVPATTKTDYKTACMECFGSEWKEMVPSKKSAPSVKIKVE